MSGESRKIHITRKGEQFGPYPEETARQFLSDGQLKATDLAWHDGADGWKPLPEVLGIAAAPDAPPPPPAPGGAPPPEPAAPAGPPWYTSPATANVTAHINMRPPKNIWPKAA